MKKLISYILIITSVFLYISSQITETVYAEPDYWPEGPDIFAEAGVLVEASTGAVLYGKNMNQQMYPASITKILTSLIALENSSLDETVLFSHEAVYSLGYGDANIGMKEGEFLTMEDSLYAILLSSANEVANAVAEHVGGSIEDFSDMMNQRAKEAGAQNSNFVNPSGLFNENHYTTCYDMAMITGAAIKNEKFLEIEANTASTIAPTNLTPETRYCNNRHKMLFPNNSVYYEGILGGKTGYVDESGNTLVTFAKRDNMTLICVVMKSDSTHVYDDTAKLLDYGFNNFKLENISSNEPAFSSNNDSLHYTYRSIFGDTPYFISINEVDSVVIPKTAAFSDVTPVIDFTSKEKDTIATIEYKYNNYYVGKTTITLEDFLSDDFDYSPLIKYSSATSTSKNWSLNINIWIMSIIIIILILLIILIKDFKKSNIRRRRRKYLKKRKY